MSEKKQIPIGEGLFVWPSDEARLIATHCKSCGDTFFPKIFTCRNPGCKEKAVEEVALSRRGKLLSYTILHYPPPPPFIVSGTYEPRAVAEVDMPEGLRLVAPMTRCDLKDIKIGMTMEIVLDRLYEDKEGKEIIGWKFRPL